MVSRITAIYRIESDAHAIGARAQALAVEQSVEMPVAAIDDRMVLDEIVGRIEGIEELAPGRFEVRIGLAVATTGPEVGQLMNMLFGNSSIHPDIELHDAILPPEILTAFGGPRHGLEGLRARVRAEGRAMTCSALKPQGFAPARLAELARRFALGGIDYIKDDHGLADQAYSPFDERVGVCAEAVAKAARETGHPTRYLPSLSGDLDRLRAQVKRARAAGLDTLLIAPLVVGLPAFHALVRENPDMAFMAHPALAGAARFAPPLLLGKLFRLFGADATVFPNHGGRFGYSRETCAALADAARGAWGALEPAVPVPAGGMTPERVPEMLDFYGTEVMLLIGGGLLAARERLTQETAAFVARVAEIKGTSRGRRR
ncbi:MAG TPA: RuBisCO large subunit C-terminal-like domain-containing protein [Alphaproteobacteria bacterium]|nr:RuBisCO large subunit C-terminal-like domain-containing protein [Alphaproteobacteria bacterium]